MILFLEGEDRQYENGIREVLHRVGLLSIFNDFTICGKKREKAGFLITNLDGKIVIEYSKINYFYQGLLEVLVLEENQVEKTMSVEKLGIMLDFARNAVFNDETLKNYLCYLALFGYTYCKLYVEDLMKLEEEPFFGYMRGAFSQEKFKEVVMFAETIGIEIVPCIQTLAHLNQIFRYNEYDQINDANDILLAGEEKTYALIEKMIKFARNTTKSDTINIGADEAEMIGFGKYFHKHGYKNRYDIIRTHLEKVLEICDKYSFKVEMWSDMIFKFVHGTYVVRDNPSMEEGKKIVPKGANLIYWDYYQQDENVYLNMIKSHKQLVKEPIYAGGIWTWRGYMPLNKYTELTMYPAIEACKKENIKNIFFTMWGDNGSECSKFSIISSLIQVPLRFQNDFDLKKVSKLLKIITEYDYYEWMALDLLNDAIRIEEYKNFNPSKGLLFDDPMTSIFDKYVNPDVENKYKESTIELKKLAKRNSKFSYIFETAYRLSKVLSYKTMMGVNIYKAYNQKNHEMIYEQIKIIERTIKAINDFYKAFKNQWHLENKNFGFDVQIIRIAGIKERLKYTAELLKDFNSGKILEIDELEQERHSVNPRSAFYISNSYSRLVSANKI